MQGQKLATFSFVHSRTLKLICLHLLHGGNFSPLYLSLIFWSGKQKVFWGNRGKKERKKGSFYWKSWLFYLASLFSQVKNVGISVNRSQITQWTSISSRFKFPTIAFKANSHILQRSHLFWKVQLLIFSRSNKSRN